MLTIKTLPSAEKFVSRQQQAGNDCYWDGWDIVFHKPNPRAVMSVHGARRNGVWGFENRFTVTEEGTWQIDSRNIRRIPRTRN